MSRAVFIHPVTKEETAIPTEIFLHAKKLEFAAQKSEGWGTGGWYRAEDGTEFLVKFGRPEMCYMEALLTDLARINIGADFVSTEVGVGHYDDQGRDKLFMAIGKIPNYRDISSIADLAERKSHAPKFHPAFAFNAFIAFDDSNEGNIGLAGDQAKLIDYGNLPTFLHPESLEHAGLPFHLASLIGHRNLQGMQMIRRRYFGHDGFLSPLTKHSEAAENPQDISYYTFLSGVKKIIDGAAATAAKIAEYIKLIKEDQAFDPKQKEAALKRFAEFGAALGARTKWMAENFAQDLENLEENAEKFSQEKWRHQPKFLELMREEEKISQEAAKKSLSENLAGIALILGLGSKEEILGFNCDGLEAEQKAKLKEFVNDNFALHNAVMTDDYEIAEWLLKNDLADINKTRTIRNHNYQNYRLTPLHTAIAIYHDRLYYDTAHSAASHEMIDLLAQKFHEKNGAEYEAGKVYEGDNLALMITFMADNTYKTRRSEVEEEAAKKIQTTFRSYMAKKLDEATHAAGKE